LQLETESHARWLNELDLRDINQRGQPKKKPAGTWTLGTRVKHAKYGYGTILRTEGSGDDLKLTVSFISHGLKKMIAKYAELEIV